MKTILTLKFKKAGGVNISINLSTHIPLTYYMLFLLWEVIKNWDDLLLMSLAPHDDEWVGRKTVHTLFSHSLIVNINRFPVFAWLWTSLWTFKSALNQAGSTKGQNEKSSFTESVKAGQVFLQRRRNNLTRDKYSLWTKWKRFFAIKWANCVGIVERLDVQGDEKSKLETK